MDRYTVVATPSASRRATTTRLSCRSTSTSPARARRSRRARQLLPGRVRRFVPEPPVAGRAQTPVYPSPLPAGHTLHSIIGRRRSPDELPAASVDRVNATVRSRWSEPATAVPAHRTVCGDLRGQHHAAGVISPLRPFGAKSAPAPPRTHRRRTVSARRVVGVVLGRLGQRRRRHNGPGLDERHRAGLQRPEVVAGDVPVLPRRLFQYHHQPFNYFANYAPGTPARRHLKDEADFLPAAKTAPARGQLRQADR